ncbi:hypothetical protein C2U55_26665 [Enterobacteriaceae bacterium ENNIH3]|nr:hypothetical protein C2U55_26665 [Enterobacteriaceae bacterium ENNIH3]AUV07565.1 hypothetical protein C2U52_15445 [Enterobacteriaceae bacterium ENNIH2]
MKQVTMESVKQRIAYIEDLNESGVGTKVDEQQFELACLRQLVAVTEQVCELNKALDVSLRVQVYQANRIIQMLDEIKRAESAIGSTGWMGIDTAITLELSKLNKQISDLQGQVRALTEQRDALVVEMKSAFEKPQAYLTWHAIPPTWEDPLPCGEYLDVHDTDGHKNSDGTDCWPVYAKPETPATDAAIASLRAEGVEMLRQKLEQEITKCYQDEQIGLDSAVTLATDFAVQLRSQSAPSPKAAAIARQFEQVKGVQS